MVLNNYYIKTDMSLVYTTVLILNPYSRTRYSQTASNTVILESWQNNICV
jgi:hypothetical protein